MTAKRQHAVRRKLEFECYPPGTLRLDKVDLNSKWPDKESYEDVLKTLQKKLLRLQIETFQKSRRAIFVFEGWDAAGKGGAIKRLTTMMDPRGYKVWPIGPPRDQEVRQHYLWRFWERLPEKGEIAVFDRSWYGRVLVERVEGLASPAEWRRAYDEINAFERMLTEDGVAMAKFFLHIDRKTQLKRFKMREHDPMKKYKITPDDWRNRKKWRDYEKAIQEMLDRTHRPDAPWHLIPANDKQYARIEVLKACAKALGD
jgi:polyphosphate kinase 2 (PPK2 family)